MFNSVKSVNLFISSFINFKSIGNVVGSKVNMANSFCNNSKALVSSIGVSNLANISASSNEAPFNNKLSTLAWYWSFNCLIL